MKKNHPPNPLILNKASQLFDNIFIKYLLSQLSSQQCPRERPGCLSQVLLKADCFISPLQKKNLITELTLHELGKNYSPQGEITSLQSFPAYSSLLEIFFLLNLEKRKLASL